MMKSKERLKRELEKMRQWEAAFDVANAEVSKLRALIADQQQLESEIDL
jgi:hypothetical protein